MTANQRVLFILCAGVVSFVSIVRLLFNFMPPPNSRNGPPVAAFNPAPCEDAWQHEIHLEKSDVDHVEQRAPVGCESGGVSLPLWWNTWEEMWAEKSPGACVYVRYDGDIP